MSYTVAQNTTFFTAASVLQRVISFGYFIIIARLVGVENTGQYFFAIAFTAIFTVVADFGLNLTLVREAARREKDFEHFANTIFWSKIFFGIFSYGLVVLFANLLGYDTTLRHLIYLSGITMFLDNIHSIFYSLFRARKNLLFEAAGVIMSQFLTLVIGGIALFLKWPLYWLILAYAIPSFCNVIYISTAARLRLGINLNFTWDKSLFKWFISMSVPFALAGIINRLFSYSDSILMSKMLSARELGLWGVPYKINFAFQFIPAALTASIYPAMSTLFVTDKDRIGDLFAKAWQYLLLIVMPIAFGLWAIAEPVIAKLYGKSYLPSVPILQLLLVSLVLSFLSFVTGATLNAINRQKIQTILLAISLVTSVTMNLILLPIFGILGAAITAAISNVILTIGGSIVVRRIVKINWRQIADYSWRIFLSAGVMGVTAYLLVQRISFIIVIPIAGLIYVVFLFFTRALTKDLLLSIVKKTKI